MTTAHPPAAIKRLKVYSGDTYSFDESRDIEFLKLLGDEIQDDHVMVITEGLQIQKTLASSFKVADSDMTEVSESDEKVVVAPLQGSGLVVDDSTAAAEGADGSPMIVAYSGSDDEDEDLNAKLAIVSGGFFGDYPDEDLIAAAAANSSVVGTTSFLDDSKKFVPKLAPVKKEEVEDFSDTGFAVATGPDNVKNEVVDPFVNAVFDDFAPKDWAFCELCGVVQDNQRKLIKVRGCGHCFCNFCFELHSATQLGPETGENSLMIKCPVESCWNEIHYDHCVALILQHNLDTKAALQGHIQQPYPISDNWEFLDRPDFA